MNKALLSTAAILGAAMAGMSQSAEVLPRAAGGAFGGTSRYPKKGRARPSGSKLARKAAEGKL
jgi:hypothetical protein